MRFLINENRDTGGPTPLDAYLAVNLQRKIESRQPFLEIGVYKGGFLNSQLLNNTNLNAIGIDPYPGLENVREVLFDNLKYFELSERYSHFENFDSFP